jgi:hypothetical protein
MKTEIKNKCNELLLLVQKDNELRNELNLALKKYAESNRKFSDGETVIICDKETGNEIGKGIVADVRACIFLDTIYLKSYSNGDEFDTAIDDLRYEIYAIKNDGTRSSKHFFCSPHFIGDTKRYSDFYIKKL